MPSVVRAITRIQDADDANLTLTNGYMVVYDSGQGKFVTQAVPGTSPGGSSSQVQYHNGSGFGGHSGFTYNGAGVVTVGTAIVSPDIRPAANGVNATGFSKADGTRVFSVDTVNGRIGINNTSPTHQMVVGSGTINSVDSTFKFLLAHSSDARFGAAVNNVVVAMYTGGTYAGVYGYNYGAGTPVVLSLNQFGGNVGIGTTTPNNKLDVAGTVQMDGLRIDVTPTVETITCTRTITISANGTNYKIPCVAA